MFFGTLVPMRLMAGSDPGDKPGDFGPAMTVEERLDQGCISGTRIIRCVPRHDRPLHQRRCRNQHFLMTTDPLSVALSARPDRARLIALEPRPPRAHNPGP